MFLVRLHIAITSGMRLLSSGWDMDLWNGAVLGEKVQGGTGESCCLEIDLICSVSVSLLHNR
jgi:hypothetical protein